MLCASELKYRSCAGEFRNEDIKCVPIVFTCEKLLNNSVRQCECEQSFLFDDIGLESRHQGKDSLPYLIQVSAMCFNQIGNTGNIKLGNI